MTFVKDDPNINREGRPKDSFSLVGMIKSKLKEVPEGQKETYAALIVKKYLHKALIEGDRTLLRDLIDRVDGKALQRLANADGSNLAPTPIMEIKKDISDNILEERKAELPTGEIKAISQSD